MSVKFYNRATGSVTYEALTRMGTYWYAQLDFPDNGWYDWRYVFTSTHSNISTDSYVTCNTYNSFDPSSISSIYWPFGADGSSWNTRGQYGWESGEFDNGDGYGWNEGTHVGSDEIYSDDWNRVPSDYGASVYSPLDGYVEKIGSYYVSGLGYSYYVSVVQKVGNKTYRFYVSHIKSNSVPVSVGQYVRAGKDKIAEIGSTGATASHAHTNLRDVTGGARTSIKFKFDAN